jgi:polyhydroxybutyrate depolymerase
MKRRTFLLSSVASTALACMGGSRRGPASPKPGRTAIEYSFEGHDRRSVLYIPEGTPAQAPLVIAIHGNNGDPAFMSKANGFDKVCDAEGWIGLYPHCNLPQDADDAQGDFRFLDKLLRETVDSLDVDRNRIYAVGFSAGGKKCYSLAARCSDLVSAIAVSGTRIGFQGQEDQFDPNRNKSERVAVLHIHGRKDFKIPIRGGKDAKHGMQGIGMREGLEIWARYNGCVPDKGLKRPQGCPSNISANGWKSKDGVAVTGLSDPTLDHTWAGWATPVVVDFLKNAPTRS